MDASSQPEWVPKTKFSPPLPAADSLPRRRLLELLQNVVASHHLTLISAPAGSGKTTLVAQFVQDASDISCAWLRLSQEDDDVAAFLIALLSALQQTSPAPGKRPLNLLTALPDASTRWRHIVGLLINDLLENNLPHLVLVLDDYHTIQSPDVHEVVAYLLDNIPPNLHLLLTTRVDPPLPLARLRLRRELAEVRLPQLSFELDETWAYFNNQWGISLAPAELNELQSRTEGWIASLHLMAMTLIHLTDPARRAAFITEFSRSNRLIFQLLAEEVLAQQPSDLQAFLLETSILSELTPALCAAVTGNSQAAHLLAFTYRRNLFLTAVEGPTGTTYRYHDLFAAFLQQQLAEYHPDRLPDLHRRAARTHPDTAEQVRHYLAVGMVEDAAGVLESIGRVELQRRNIRRQTCDLILALPEAVRSTRAWLLLTLGTYHAQRGQYAAGDPHFRQAETVIQSNGDQLAEIELLADKAWMVGAPDDELRATINAKLASVPHLITPAQRATFHSTAQWHYYLRADWPNLTHHVQAGIDLALQGNDEGAASIVVQAFGPELLFNDGGLATSEPLIQYLTGRPDLDDWPWQLCLHLLRGWIAYFQGRPAAAENDCRAALSILQQIGNAGWTDGQIACLELSLLRWRQAYAQLQARTEDILAKLAAGNVAFNMIESFLFFQAQAALLRGQIDEAKGVHERLKSMSNKFFFSLYTHVQTTLLAGQIALAEERLAEAETQLQQAATLHRQMRCAVWYPHPGLSLARLYLTQGNSARALTELQTVLADVDRFQAPGMLLQEGAPILPLLHLATERGLRPNIIAPILTLLAQANEPRPVNIPNSPESLSPREMEVLHLLAAGASNNAIAQTLVITERTVKAHVSSILSKLGIKKRGEAVARARSLHLIS